MRAEESGAGEGGLRLEIAARTDVGRRREGNEDRALIALTTGEAHDAPWTGSAEVGSDGAVLAVCDGMGGAAGGEVASSEAVEVLRARLARPLGGRRDPSSMAERLVDALRIAARTIRDHSIREPALGGMGTTATVVALLDEQMLVAQVGDSRAYVLRGGVLTQVTRDQTLARLLVERGQLTEEQAERFEAAHVILQAVGTSPHLDVDLRSVDLADGDVVLVCSDGLCGPVTDARIAEILTREGDPAASCDALIAAALEAGGPDNVTCIVARVRSSTARDTPPRTEHFVFDPSDQTPPTDPAPTPADTNDTRRVPILRQLVNALTWRRE